MKPVRILRAVPNKREFAARMLARLGVVRALERTAAAWNPGLTVLTYHRVAEPATNPFYDPVISATPDAFRAQIGWLCEHAHILTLEALIDRAENDALWKEPTVLVTFDDGYRDNFDVALPILAEQHVPATFFIPPGFLDTPRLPWWDHVAYVIKRTQVRKLTLDRNLNGKASPIEIDVETLPRTTAIMTIIRALLEDTVLDQPRFLNELARRAEVDVDAESPGRSLFMNWDQVRHLARSGPTFTIGSHSHSHANLARLDDDSQRLELTGSKQILEARIGCEIKALAYPYGWRGTFTSRTKEIASQTGYRLAFASQEGTNRRAEFDRWEVSRLGVGSADSTMLLRARMALHAAFGGSFL